MRFNTARFNNAENKIDTSGIIYRGSRKDITSVGWGLGSGVVLHMMFVVLVRY